MERDEKKLRKSPPLIISTHTLTWSVTFTWNNLPDTIDISTHTLTWSVTEFFDNEMYIPKISTHTLTWSVTGGGSGQGTSENDFNSHAHVERDTTLKGVVGKEVISTHTLTWSVTCLLSLAGKITSISTHTLTWSVTKNNS